MTRGLLELRPHGLYCPAGDFYIDAWRPVQRNVLTHAHADHARSGHAHYFCTPGSLGLLRQRLGAQRFHVWREGEPQRLGGARVSLHPAGHVLGSAQVRIEVAGRVAVVTGDFKRAPDPTCAPFQPLSCDLLVTEATFALPVYQWPGFTEVLDDMVGWIEDCLGQGESAVLLAYSLGKAQRLLHGLRQRLAQPVLVHGAVAALNRIYEAAGVTLAPWESWSESRRPPRPAVVLAPPSAWGSPWMNRFRPLRSAFCSGWMQLRGARRRRNHDRGFVLSDHADWPALLQTIADSAPELVLATHGTTDALVRFLSERGQACQPLRTAFEGENE